MSGTISGVAAAPTRRRRLRFGLRGLLGTILLLGIFLGWIADLHRRAAERELFVAGLERDGVLVNHRQPTLLCFALMKALSKNDLQVVASCGRWLGPGWFSRPMGFNAGKLAEDRVPGVVGRLGRLGAVWEITYTHPSLKGLKLFYIDAYPKANLGPHGGSCVIRRHPPADAGNRAT